MPLRSRLTKCESWTGRALVPGKEEVLSLQGRVKAVLRTLRSNLKSRPRKTSKSATATGEPRFADLIDARGEWLYAKLPRPAADYLYHLHGKDKQKALARHVGVSVAQEYVSGVPLADALAFIESSPLELFVLKPNNGRSGSGVFCLVREPGGFRELKSGKVHRLGRIRELALESYGALKRADEWLVEELLLPSDGGVRHIEDYKFYCFAGRVELILQKGDIGAGRNMRHVIRFYGRDGQAVDTGVWPHATSDELVPTPNLEVLIAESERIAGQLTTPFMRIDLYDSQRGVVLGEFTPGPGGLRLFNQAWTERLTRRWHEAAVELEADLTSGRRKPLLPEQAHTTAPSTGNELLGGEVALGRL